MCGWDWENNFPKTTKQVGGRGKILIGDFPIRHSVS